MNSVNYRGQKKDLIEQNLFVWRKIVSSANSQTETLPYFEVV